MDKNNTKLIHTKQTDAAVWSVLLFLEKGSQKCGV